MGAIMNRTVRALAILGTFLGLLGVAAGPAHAGYLPEQPFYADSGDSCPMGLTKGGFYWEVPPGIVTAVGYVLDRPASKDDVAAGCTDARRTTAYFYGYNGKVLLDSEAIVVNNEQLDFKFVLSVDRPWPGMLLIDRVVVQVCRDFADIIGGPPVICGKPVEYLPPK
jgi:hypothetical protein